MTTFVHIGDFHAAPGPRNAARYRALDQIIAEASPLPTLGAWLWPGDLNHSRMTIEDRNALAERLVRMADVAPVLLAYGNHDLPGDLDVFARLRAAYPIIVVDRPRCVYLHLATNDPALIFVLPYPTKAGLASIGVAPDQVIPTAAEALDFIFMEAAGELERGRAAHQLTLMIGHVNVAGALTSVGQPNVGHEIEITAAHLDRLGPIYKGLNHVHKSQTIADAWYPGSVCRLNWGEIEDKGYIVVDINDHGCYFPEWHPIDVAPMYHVEGSLTRDGFTWTVKAGPGGDVQPAPASWAGCEVRVRYAFPQSEKTVLAHDQVAAVFADAEHLEVEPIAVPDRQLRAPAVVSAVTLPEKLAAYLQVETLAPTLAEKVARLETAEPTRLLADVQQQLAALEAEESAVPV